MSTIEEAVNEANPAEPERRTWVVSLPDSRIDRRVTAYGFTVEHGCLQFYDHGIVLALAPGQWSRVEPAAEESA